MLILGYKLNVMKHRIILLLITITLLNGQLIGSTEPIIDGLVETKVMETAMIVEINGAIQLYSVLKEEIELIDTELIQNANRENPDNWHLAYNRDYFIGYNDTDVEAITPSNFKRIAKKYFANTPYLVEKIGKRGFRYKNLPTIISYYNKQITQGEGLTKADKLLIKVLK